VPLAMRSLPRGGPRPDPRRGAGFQFFDNTRRHSCVEITFHSTAPLLQRAVVFYKPPRTGVAQCFIFLALRSCWTGRGGFRARTRVLKISKGSKPILTKGKSATSVGAVAFRGVFHTLSRHASREGVEGRAVGASTALRRTESER
jgi:hypothetical protein